MFSFLQCRSHRVASLLVAMLAAGMPAFGLALASAPAAAATTCPTSGGVPFSGALSNGSIALGTAVSGSGISGDVCGVLATTSRGYSVTIPESGISFAPTHVTILGLASLPATIAPAGSGKGTVTAGSDGTFKTRISVPVTSTVSALGFDCTVGPFDPVLTTGRSGSVRGRKLSGGLSDLTGRLVAGEFSVPAVQPSESCPSLVAALVNTLTGLPLAAGQSTLTAKASLSVG